MFTTLTGLPTVVAHTAATAAVTPPDLDTTRLVVSAIAGIVALILMITWLKLHPFLALFIASLGIGLGAGYGATPTLTSFTTTFGSTMAGVGILVGLGAMFGKILADSGGADVVVDKLVGRASTRSLPWMMALVGAVIGLPMFFEVGLVLLIPVILLVARRSGAPLMRIAIPTLAGLSAMHGLVPPHPGPLAAIATLNANLGLTLAFGLVVAIPTVIVAGPVFSRFAARWVDVPVPDLVVTAEDTDPRTARLGRRPSFVAAVSCILLPVVLMLARSAAEIIDPIVVGADGAPLPRSGVATFLEFLGTPAIALGIGLLVGMVALGRGGGMSWKDVNSSVASGLPAIAGILLIVGAGGGLKGVLVDTGIGKVIGDAVNDHAANGVALLLIAWLIAVVIRVATGSATVATVTAAGIMAEIATQMDLSSSMLALLVLAIGAGSLFLSHVNDAGFWLVKEYMGVSVGQNFKTWSMMECLISVVALVPILVISLFV